MPDPAAGVVRRTKAQDVRRLLREIRELATRHQRAGSNEPMLMHDLRLIEELVEELEGMLRSDRDGGCGSGG